jgi:hypothetical protein
MFGAFLNCGEVAAKERPAGNPSSIILSASYCAYAQQLRSGQSNFLRQELAGAIVVLCHDSQKGGPSGGRNQGRV